ncbi:MAG: DUF4105 domain-containing protein [Candidatus Methylomirabilales bacterium]
MRIVGGVFLGLFLFLLWSWATLAIYYSNLPSLSLRAIAAGAFGLGSLGAFLWFPNRWRTIRYFLSAFLLVLVWWSLIPASNDRDWRPEVAVLAHATFDGDVVTVHNIRNFDYSTRDDFTIQYYDKTYDLATLQSVDFIVSYWGGIEAIAHTFLSFGFADGDYLAISIEVRPEKGETYHPIKGFFKQYELIYVIGDERDLVRVRANHRGEDVYLYRTTISPAQARILFQDMLRRANTLADEPAFYRTIGQNCTTSLINHFNLISPKKIRFHRKIVLNGYSDELAYERGRIASDLPFPEMKRAHRITEIAQAYDDDPEFSRKIRAKLG